MSCLYAKRPFAMLELIVWDVSTLTSEFVYVPSSMLMLPQQLCLTIEILEVKWHANECYYVGIESSVLCHPKNCEARAMCSMS